MRVTAIVFAVALSIAGSASAQEWEQYVSTQDGFKIDFPGAAEDRRPRPGSPSTGYMLAGARVQRRQREGTLFDNVVDYNGIEKMGAERRRSARRERRPARDSVPAVCRTSSARPIQRRTSAARSSTRRSSSSSAMRPSPLTCGTGRISSKATRSI